MSIHIYRAVKTNSISQWFGGNKEWYQKLLNDPTCKGHNGIDFRCSYGEPIYWDCDVRGEVLDCHIDRNGGWGVRVITRNPDFKHLFWHLKEFKCQAGQILGSGDLIGYGDSTGRSTGNHLHRSLKPVHLNFQGNWVNTYGSNGYYGAIDYKPYFINIYIKDKMANLQKQKSILEKMVEIYQKLIKLRIQIKS